MAEEGRALMTERERAIISEEADDVSDNYEYKVQSLVRNRVKKKFGDDVDILEDHFDEVYRMIEAAVCGDIPDDEAELRGRLQDAHERIDDLENSLAIDREESQERKELLEDCREQLADAPDRDELARTIGELETALERGDRTDVQACLDRIKTAAGVDDD